MQLPYLADRGAVRDAADLIATYGEAAAQQAVQRADRYRDLGNARHFCRWRQIARLIALLTHQRPVGTVH